VSSGQLRDALATLAESKIFADRGVTIDPTATVKVLDYGGGIGGGSIRPGSVHRIVRLQLPLAQSITLTLQ
jgi:hypothetical protein